MENSNSNSRSRRRSDNRSDEKGLLWKLPAIKSSEFGKLGPAFGIGAGCGIGFAFGLIGGAGFGPGIPGMQFGFGVGAGCGVGIGFGYGLGKGIAYDENRKYSNIKKPFSGSNNLPIDSDLGALFDEIVLHSKKLVQATSKGIEKWTR